MIKPLVLIGQAVARVSLIPKYSVAAAASTRGRPASKLDYASLVSRPLKSWTLAWASAGPRLIMQINPRDAGVFCERESRRAIIYRRVLLDRVCWFTPRFLVNYDASTALREFITSRELIYSTASSEARKDRGFSWIVVERKRKRERTRCLVYRVDDSLAGNASPRAFSRLRNGEPE